MKIRADLIGCVFTDGRRLFAGDDVPEDVQVADWLLEGNQTTQQEEPAEEESTEIVIDEDEDPAKPARADNKQTWFDYATEQGAIEDGATIEDYSKADLIELVG
jgi:hypothetical protein